MKKPGKMTFMVMETAFRKPATVCYPFVNVEKCKDFRGKLAFFADKCIGCKLCMKDCPSNAINIVKIADKKFECEIDLDKCIYCAQCVDSCMKKALVTTKEFALASLDSKSLKVNIHEPKKDTEPKA